MKFLYPFFMLIILLLYKPVHAQQQAFSDLTFIVGHNKQQKKEVECKVHDQKPAYQHEITMAITGLIRIYQLFISSQQSSSVCVFYPSCSHFGMLSFQCFGVFKGGLLTADRLQRCHGLAREYYQPYQSTPKLFDPVENYNFSGHD